MESIISLYISRICKVIKQKIIKIQKYGEVKNVLYGDLIAIINNHFKLASEGGFYIFDREAVALTGLADAYEHMLDKTGMEALLAKPIEEIRSTFEEISDYQKETFATCVVNALVQGLEISTVKINLIEEITGSPIMTRVDDRLNFEKKVAESEA